MFTSGPLMADERASLASSVDDQPIGRALRRVQNITDRPIHPPVVVVVESLRQLGARLVRQATVHLPNHSAGPRGALDELAQDQAPNLQAQAGRRDVAGGLVNRSANLVRRQRKIVRPASQG